jgi:hypothetical protein
MISNVRRTLEHVDIISNLSKISFEYQKLNSCHTLYNNMIQTNNCLGLIGKFVEAVIPANPLQKLLKWRFFQIFYKIEVFCKKKRSLTITGLVLEIQLA